MIFSLLVPVLSGCTTMATRRMAQNLQTGIVNQNDPEIVKDGAPAFMIMLDGLIRENPKNQDLLLAGARLYSVYATVFVAEKDRVRLLSEKARDYARRAVCLVQAALCDPDQQAFDRFNLVVNTIGRADIDALYTYAMAWAGWIMARSDDWNAIADLPKIESMMQRVVALDDAYQQGQAHLYLGILNTRLPANLGGKPEQGRAHFEHAIELSNGRNLIAKVEMARRYARLVFDRQLHDRLLTEVINAQTEEPGLTLSNTLAQQQAVELLESAKDYF
jgi:hypothetical protein